MTRLDVTLSDGKPYVLKALAKEELNAKKAQKNYEGDIYRKMFKLLDDNYDQIKKAKPNVSKNSTGYNLWDVWDRETGIFDLTKLFVGSQGTLGLVEAGGERAVIRAQLRNRRAAVPLLRGVAFRQP